MKIKWMFAMVLLALSVEYGRSQTISPVTTVQDTVYTAGGPASGTLTVSWPAFTSASGAAVPAGTTSATVGADGTFSITLTANAGATPVGSYYSVRFTPSGVGPTISEYWVIPLTVVGAPPVGLNQVRLPMF